MDLLDTDPATWTLGSTLDVWFELYGDAGVPGEPPERAPRRQKRTRRSRVREGTRANDLAPGEAG